MNNIEQQNNNKVYVIWTDTETNETYKADVPFDTKLDFERMNNVVLSM